MYKKYSVAIVVPGLSTGGGGVLSVASFLHQVLSASHSYHPELVSIATSAHDSTSTRLMSPSSWLRGVQAVQNERQNKKFVHIGAHLTELEFQRYLPRRILTDLLNSYDLVQIVAGSPAWALVAKEVVPPVTLQVATLASLERRSKLAAISGYRRIWLSLMTSIVSTLDRKALQEVDIAFVENKWMLDHLRGFIGPQRVVFAPPGVDIKVFCPGNYQPNGPILSVGRFADARKNIGLLFEAYYFLRRHMPQAPKLIIAGRSAPLQKDWAKAVSLGIANDVDIRQNLSTNGLAELYRSASIFALSSDEEGLGLVLLEAMASGIPVVSTRCGGPATAVINGETGLLTPVGDAAALAQAMQRLLHNDQLRRRMGQAARQRAKACFSLEAAGQVYLDKYDELLERKIH
jgi:D-inositol-3-phosphate glycosyltransferase